MKLTLATVVAAAAFAQVAVASDIEGEHRACYSRSADHDREHVVSPRPHEVAGFREEDLPVSIDWRAVKSKTSGAPLVTISRNQVRLSRAASRSWRSTFSQRTVPPPPPRFPPPDFTAHPKLLWRVLGVCLDLELERPHPHHDRRAVPAGQVRLPCFAWRSPRQQTHS